MRVPTVSVVIPTRDRPATLGAALRSALDQAGVDVEVVVVDDGSGHATAELLAGLTDPRLRVLRNDRPEGVAAARNRGLAAAAGEWVAFLDDDDLWAPTKLARQLTRARRSGAGWSCCEAVVVDASLRPLRHQRVPDGLVDELTRWNAVPGGGSGVVARRDLVRAVGGFDPGLAILADWDLWLRLARTGAPATIAEPLVAYRLQGGSLSHRLVGIRREMATVRRRHGVAPDRRRWRLWLAEMHQRSGRRLPAAASYLLGAGSLLPPAAAARRAGGALLYGPGAIARRDDVDAAALDARVREAVARWLPSGAAAAGRPAAPAGPRAPGAA